MTSAPGQSDITRTDELEIGSCRCCLLEIPSGTLTELCLRCFHGLVLETSTLSIKCGIHDKRT